MRLRIMPLLITLLFLVSCSKGVSSEVPLIPTVDDNVFNQATAIPKVKSGDVPDISQAHLVVTSASIPPYPTPLATFLVRSSIITVTIPPASTTTATPTPVNSRTVQPTTVVTATPNPTATQGIQPTSVAYQYTAQSGSPAYLPNFVNTSAACNWQGIAGQVFDPGGNPVKNVVIRIGGTWNGQNINMVGLTGSASAYGEGGYELVLGNKAITSSSSLWVQAYDLQGNALSEQYKVNTYSDCTKALVIFNFKYVAGGYNVPVPVIVKTALP